MSRRRGAVLMVAFAWGLGAALIGASQVLALQPDDSCDRYGAARDLFLDRTAAGIAPHIDTMAAQRGVPREAAAFYWAGALLRSGDEGSMDTLAHLTLASGQWPGQAARAERALERIHADHGSTTAGLLAGLLLSDGRGEDDPYRARAYLADAERAGHSHAGYFRELFDTCHGRRLAMQ